MKRVLGQLNGAVNFVAPQQPLAMTNLLACMLPGAAANLATTQHPVIQVGQYGNFEQSLLLASMAHLSCTVT